MYPAIEDQLRAIRREATYSERLAAWGAIVTPPVSIWQRIGSGLAVLGDLPRRSVAWLTMAER